MPTPDTGSGQPTPDADDGGRILAAVVTFNPDPCLLGALRTLRPQVDEVVVIDNGSADADAVARVAEQSGCRLVANAENLGIAAALSQAARLAAEGGFAWLATFDQDSRLAPGSIAGLLELCRALPDRRRVGILSLSHRDRLTGRDYHLPWDVIAEAETWRSVHTTITSGAMIPTRVFSLVGTFDDPLFIDSVDHEFCLRCRRHGLLVIESKVLVLDHAKGRASEHRFLWFKVPAANQPANRRYYITRNQLELFRRYLFVDPIWTVTSMLVGLAELIILLLFESDRRAKIRAIVEGAVDFANRRFGARKHLRG